MTNLNTLTAAQLVAVFNHYADKPVTRFESAAAGRTRLAKLLATIQAPECQAILAVIAPETAPVEAAIAAEVDPTTQLGFLGPMPGLTPADQGIAAAKADDAERDAIAAEVAAANERIGAAKEKRAAKQGAKADRRRADKLAARIEAKAKPVKAAKATTIHVANGDAKAPTGAKATILAMIARKGGTSEKEVCAALGWPRAGGTISRTIAIAPFAVVKMKGDDGRTRYSKA